MIKLFKNDIDNELLGLTTNLTLMEIFNVFSTVIDTLLVSLVSQAYLSGVSFAGQFITVYVWAIFGLNRAVMVLATQYYGKKDEESLKKILNTSILFSIIVSIVFFICTRFFSMQIMNFLTSDQEVALIGAKYLHIYSFAALFNALSKMYISVLKSTDKEKMATIASGTGVVFNTIFDILLIFGLFGMPKLGVEGAATAAVIGSCVEFLICFILSNRKGFTKYNIFRILKPDIYFLKEIFKYALPVVICYSGWALADTMTVSVIGHMNRNIIDAFAFVKIFVNLPQSFVTGFGMAFSIIIGRELGKNNLKLAKEYGEKGLRGARKLSFFVFGITAIITIGGTLIKGITMPVLTAYLIVSLAYSYRFFGATIINYFNCGPLSAGGETEFLMLADMVNMWCIIVPFSMIFYYVLKLPEAVVVFFICSSEYTKMYAVWSHYKKYVWVRDLTKNDWYLPLAGSFIDKYKRNFKLKIRINISELFTKRFENSTDFIFSLGKNNFNEAITNFQAYLNDMGIEKNVSYKSSLAIEEIYVASKNNTLKEKSDKYDFSADIGVRIKNEKVRFIYYDNGINLKSTLENAENANIHVLKSIAEKFEHKRIIGLNKILVRFNRS